VTSTVSVGLPVYNGAKWLSGSVESVLGQRGIDFELIISDNASTDETESMCREMAARDPRIRYHRNAENIGVAHNFSNAFRLSRSRYFKWMSCGDAIDPTFLSRCVEVLDQRPEVALVYPITRLFEDSLDRGAVAEDDFDLDNADPVARFKTYLRQVRLNNIMHGVYRADMLGRTRLYSGFLAADVNMIAELLLHGRAVQLPDVLNFRRSHPETMSKLASAAALRAMYVPKKPSALKYQAWTQMLDFLQAPFRTDALTWQQRIRLGTFVSRMLVWRSGELLHELANRGHSK
jgi:glycosyltransferase involved in cell wall biosynthesis